MKNMIRLLAAIACLMFSLADAQAITIYDDYWGGVVQNSGATTYGDVIGYPDFAVDKIDVTVSGSQMTVKLSGNYFKTGEVNSWGPGDLYISTSGWQTSDGQTSGYHATDAFQESEGWNYVVSYGGRHYDPNGNFLPDQTGGIVSKLTFLSDESVPYPLVMTNTFGHGAPSGWIFRGGQAYWGGYGQKVGEGSIPVMDPNAGTLTFNFPISGIPDYDNWPYWGFHWNMKN
jgi:hypothetical protein